MISTATAAALVSGGAAPSGSKLMKLEVARAFCIKGERLDVGASLEVPPVIARELISNGKAVPFVEKARATARVQEKK